jgi:hypothetical protein
MKQWISSKRIAATGMLAIGAMLMTLSAHASLVGSAPGSSDVALTPVASAQTEAQMLTFGTPEVEVVSVNYLASAFAKPAGDILDVARIVDVSSEVSHYAGGINERGGQSRVTVVPEPSVVLLLVTGLIALVLSRRRRRS